MCMILKIILKKLFTISLILSYFIFCYLIIDKFNNWSIQKLVDFFSIIGQRLQRLSTLCFDFLQTRQFFLYFLKFPEKKRLTIFSNNKRNYKYQKCFKLGFGRFSFVPFQVLFQITYKWCNQRTEKRQTDLKYKWLNE